MMGNCHCLPSLRASVWRTRNGLGRIMFGRGHVSLDRLDHLRLDTRIASGLPRCR